MMKPLTEGRTHPCLLVGPLGASGSSSYFLRLAGSAPFPLTKLALRGAGGSLDRGVGPLLLQLMQMIF